MNERSSLIKKIQDKVNRSLYLSSTQLISEKFERFAKEIEKFDPKIIRCYPTPLLFLANQIEKSTGTYKGNSLLAINTTGSTLNPASRKKIENVFGVRIFDSYSCEGGTVFSQCNESKMYHPAPEYAISEFIDDDFTQSNPKRPRRHITTDLVNFASPFIRYDTQDYIVLDEKECGCRRNFHNINSVMGRDSDILVTPSRKYLIVENFVAYFEWIVEVDQIQVVQTEIDKITIKMIVNQSFNDEVLNKIMKYWIDYIGSDVKLTFQLVDEIKLTPSGKRRTIIRDPKIKLDNGW